MRCTEHDPLWYDCEGCPCMLCPNRCPDCLRYGDLCECEPYENLDDEEFDGGDIE